MTIPRVLIIAGSDSGGGAGIQADIKTVTCLGGYASTAITALTAQNTQGVFGIHEVPLDFIEQQIRLVLDDIGADCIKTGMLHSTPVIDTVARVLADYPDIPLVLDPVMVAKGGAPLLQPDAITALKKLIARATVITPNVPEAELLSEMQVSGVREMETVGTQLLKLGCKAVLMKGGHLENDEVTDILICTSDTRHLTPVSFTSPRLGTPHTHGTGCTLASALATHLAGKAPLEEAVKRARDYVFQAIKQAPGLGHGHGPLRHNWAIPGPKISRSL